MRVYMRNKMSGEIREVEADSGEFRDLQGQVTPAGLTMWEQTHFPQAKAIKERAASDELLEEDLGHDDQADLRYAALQLDAEGVAPESNPHLSLTPGEIEAGLTPSDKLDDLRAMYEERQAKQRGSVFSDVAERIRDEEAEKPEVQPARGQRARAGGSDERTEVPAVEAKDDEKPNQMATPSRTGARAQSQPAPVTTPASGEGES